MGPLFDNKHTLVKDIGIEPCQDGAAEAASDDQDVCVVCVPAQNAFLVGKEPREEGNKAKQEEEHEQVFLVVSVFEKIPSLREPIHPGKTKMSLFIRFPLN